MVDNINLHPSGSGYSDSDSSDSESDQSCYTLIMYFPGYGDHVFTRTTSVILFETTIASVPRSQDRYAKEVAAHARGYGPDAALEWSHYLAQLGCTRENFLPFVRAHIDIFHCTIMSP